MFDFLLNHTQTSMVKARAHTRKQAHTYICIYTFIHTYTYTYAYTYKCTNIHMHIIYLNINQLDALIFL